MNYRFCSGKCLSCPEYDNEESYCKYHAVEIQLIEMDGRTEIQVVEKED